MFAFVIILHFSLRGHNYALIYYTYGLIESVKYSGNAWDEEYVHFKEKKTKENSSITLHTVSRPCVLYNDLFKHSHMM